MLDENSDCINELAITECDISQQIEHLVKETTLQKHRTAELESQLASRMTDSDTVPCKIQKKVHPEKRTNSRSPIRAQKDKR
jgi:septal ring factor EnvC (AmiA/AmiB activator)